MSNQSSRRPTPITLLQQAAGDAWRRRDFGAYFDLMGQADLLSPRNPALLLDLGTAYGLRTRFPEAVQFFERAVAESRDKSNMLSKIGYVCREFQRYDLAAHYLRRAAEEPGVPPDTHAKLAEIEERQRETGAAEAAVERALKIDAKCQLALLVRARLNRVAGYLDEAEKVVRFLLSRTDRSGSTTRHRGWYELAAILDHQGRYEEAFDALTMVKKMMVPSAAGAVTERKAVLRGLHQAAGELSSSYFQRWNAMDPGPAPRRLAVIMGHPRSGTTLLEQVLDAHTAVVSAEETLIFWDSYNDLERDHRGTTVTMLDSLSPLAVRNARDDYFRRMELFVSVPVGDRVLIDKNPSLTALLPALLRVLPQAQIIVALRDPRDVCLSCFMQRLAINPVSAMYLTLEGTVEEYCSLMGFWRTIKPMLPTPALEVRYEDVVTDLRSEGEKALRFLNLDWEPAVLNFHEQARKKLIISPTYADVARPIHRGAVGRWRNYRKYLEPYLEKLAPFVKAFGYEAD